MVGSIYLSKIYFTDLIKYIGKISDDKLNIVFKTFCKDLGCNK